MESHSAPSIGTLHPGPCVHVENSNLLCKGKYHCTADLLLDWFGFEQTSKSVDSFNTTKQLSPNQSNRVSGSCQLFMRIKTFIGLEHNIQILDEHFSN